jgi:NAD(P)-dependent dehydrogenase (short-subunit alcohol dehydrogenase family)
MKRDGKTAVVTRAKPESCGTPRAGAQVDVASVVAFRVSNDSHWVTGTAVEASGDQWLGPVLG